VTYLSPSALWKHRLTVSIGIIQASIDVLTEMGFLSSVLQLITLLQSIKSARWPDDQALSILPGILPTAISQDLPASLNDLVLLSPQALKALPERLSLSTTMQKEFHRFASSIPNLEIDISDITASSMTVHLSRINPIAEHEGRAYTPLFPKMHVEGWFVILIDKSTDEILALKRVGWTATKQDQSQKTEQDNRGVRVGSRPKAKTTIRNFQQPNVINVNGVDNRRSLDIMVISDVYPGLSFSVSGIRVPEIPPAVNSNHSKTKDDSILAGGAVEMAINASGSLDKTLK
jgi:antiviral helicase SLH1